MKYLSKLLSMLLIGAMLTVTACTDYDEDIRNLNDKVDELEKELVEGQINPLKADLEQAKKDLSDALAAAEERLATAHKADVDALKAVDEALDGKIADANEAILALEGALAQEVADLEAEIDALEAALATAKKEAADADAALKAELVKEITDLETELLNKVNELQTKLEGDIADLRADMQKKIDEANDAIEDANDAIDELDLRATNLEATDEELKAKDEALQAEIDETQTDLAATNAALAEAKEKFEQALAEEAAARAAGDTELANAIAEEVKAREAAVKALEDSIAALQAKLEGEINLLKHRDAELESQLAAAQRGIEALGEKVEAYYEEVKADAKALETKLQAQIDANTTAIAQNKANINNALAAIETINTNLASLQGSLAALNGTLVQHMAEFNNYKAEVNGRLASLEARATELENAIADLKENIIPGIEQQIAINEGLIEQNAADIAANAEALEAYKEAAADTFEKLMDADTALWTAIATLNGTVYENKTAINDLRCELEDYKATIETELDTKFAALQEQIQAIRDAHAADKAAVLEELAANKAFAERNLERINKEIEDRQAADAAISAELLSFKEQYEAKMKELDAAIAALNERIDDLEKALEDFKTEVEKNLKDAMEKTLEDAKVYTDKKVGDLTTTVTDLASELRDADKALSNNLDATKEALEGADKAIYEKIRIEVENLQAQIENLLNRIQSVAFVPEYNDGKATINWATAGDNEIVEARSVLEYQVYPAECASAIKTLFNKRAGLVRFDLEGLKDYTTRTGAEEAKYVLNPVGVELGDKPGRILVSVDARNLGKDFYSNELEYGISMIINDGTANLASCYTIATAATPNAIEMDIIQKDVNGVEVSVNETIAPMHEIEYVNTVDPVIILDGHFVRFTVAGEKYDSIEALQAAGYDIEMSVAYMYESGRGEADDKEPFNLTTDENGQMRVNVATVDKQYIYDKDDAPENYVNFWYVYTARGLDVYAGSTVITTPVKAKAILEDAKIMWTYDLDAVVDADIYKNKEAATLHYKRSMKLNVVKTEDLPEDTTIVDVINNGELKKITVDGVELTGEGMFANLFIAGEDTVPTFEISKFQWDGKKHNFAFTYHLQNVDVEVSFIVANDPYKTAEIVITEEDTLTIEKDMIFEVFSDVTKPMDLMKVHTDIAGMNNLGYRFQNADEWSGFLDEVLGDTVNPLMGVVTAPEYTVTYVATDGVNTIEKTAKPEWSTNMKLTHDGNFASIGFNYKSFDFIPTKVTYTMDVTLWYGQKAKFVYTLNFVRPEIYDFYHNDLWVFVDQDKDGNNIFYSKAQGRYTTDQNKTVVDKDNVSVRFFDIENINMDKVFNVGEKQGDKLYILRDDNTDFADRGLVTEFGFVTAPKDSNIRFSEDDPNILKYNGRDKLVYVYGKLYLQNSNGAKIQLATSFDEGKAYDDYFIKKFDPLTALTADKKVVYVAINEVKKFDINVLKNFSIYESRNGDGEKYELEYDGNKFFVDLITDAGKWMTGSGYNGWYYGKDVNDMFGVDFQTGWSDVSAAIPQQYYNYINWNEGVLTFDNTYNLDLAVPVKIPVTVTVDYKWAPEGGKKADCMVVFYNPKYFTPAE